MESSNCERLALSNVFPDVYIPRGETWQQEELQLIQMTILTIPEMQNHPQPHIYCHLQGICCGVAGAVAGAEDKEGSNYINKSTQATPEGVSYKIHTDKLNI